MRKTKYGNMLKKNGGEAYQGICDRLWLRWPYCTALFSSVMPEFQAKKNKFARVYSTPITTQKTVNFKKIHIPLTKENPAKKYTNTWIGPLEDVATKLSEFTYLTVFETIKGFRVNFLPRPPKAMHWSLCQSQNGI